MNDIIVYLSLYNLIITGPLKPHTKISCFNNLLFTPIYNIKINVYRTNKFWQRLQQDFYTPTRQGYCIAVQRSLCIPRSNCKLCILSLEGGLIVVLNHCERWTIKITRKEMVIFDVWCYRKLQIVGTSYNRNSIWRHWSKKE